MFLKYLWYLIKHKWYVLIECIKLGVVWRGIIHDLHKFSPVEFIAYARYFYGEYPTEAAVRLSNYTGATKESAKRDFDNAWLHHQKHPLGDHHWQYWLLQYDAANDWCVQCMADGYPMILTGHGKPMLECFAFDYKNDAPWYDEASRRLDLIVAELNRKPIALPMPDKCRREMLADWRGASKAATGKDDTQNWYRKNKDKIILHPDTREWIEAHLCLF